MEKISAIIITKDEEADLRQCLESIKYVDDIVVVDSGSTDNTLGIAKDYTSSLFVREFDDFSAQKNFAISKCKNNWVLSLDADEVVSPALGQRLKDFVPGEEAGYNLKRETYIFGKLMKHGGHDNDTPLRLFDKRKGAFVQTIHEFVKMEGKTSLLSEPIIHYSTKNINEYMDKLNLYTDSEARFLKEEKAVFFYTKMIFLPVVRFIQRYILQKGFMDGEEGFIFYALSGFYIYLKWFKYNELLKVDRRI